MVPARRTQAVVAVLAVVVLAGGLAAVIVGSRDRQPRPVVAAGPPPPGASDAPVPQGDPTLDGSAAGEAVAAAPLPTAPPSTIAVGASAPAGAAAPAAAGGPGAVPPPPAPLSEPNRVASSGAVADRGSGAAWPGDFPDPFVLRVGTTYHAYATQSGLTQVQTLTSTDLRTWQRGDDALARLPSWAEYGYVWAPSVLPRGNAYVLYYATRVRATGRQCLSRAVSLLPQGPFVDTSNGPFVCQLDRGGSIDPSPFVDADGSAWLLWKSEGTLSGEPTRIWSARLAADGRDLAGPPVELLHTEQPWEQPIIERPSMIRGADGHYYLFYSGNRWQTASYAVGWAVCAGPAGPCRRGDAQPVLYSHDAVAGPGSAQEFTDVTGVAHMAYCSWTAGAVGYPSGARRLHLATLTFAGGRPSLSG